MAIDKYSVFGNPIQHSLSPKIHAAFAKETKQKMEYTRQQVEMGQFEPSAKEFFSNGGKGLNITVPFKEKAFDFAEQKSERAEIAGAVNTLTLQSDGSIFGDNTDGVGLVSDIVERLGWQLQGKRILCLGAGGAARGVLLPLLKSEPDHITVANRTESKAKELASLFSPYGKVLSSAYSALGDKKFDLIINATSASLSGALPPVSAKVIGDDAAVYDMVYSNTSTAFLDWAMAMGVKHHSDGLGMLLGQAAESFKLWRGVMPAVVPVIEAMRKE